MRIGLDGAPTMTVETDSGALRLMPPEKGQQRQFSKVIKSGDKKAMKRLFAQLLSRNENGIAVKVKDLNDWTVEDALYFAKGYMQFLNEIRACKAAELPYYPDKNDNFFKTETSWERLVADYAGISLFDVEKLDYYEYLVLRRDAFITALNGTSAGREYLENAHRLTVTEPDREGLRRHFGKGKR